MDIEYIPTKKLDKSGGENKEMYYATACTSGKKNMTELEISEILAKGSSLSQGDTLSVLNQLPEVISDALADGRRVSLAGLGSLFPTVTSEGVAGAHELTPDKVHLSRISFKADHRLVERVKKSSFKKLKQHP